MKFFRPLILVSLPVILSFATAIASDQGDEIASISNSLKLAQITELKRLAFGSCNNQNDSQPIWKDLIAQKPDLFVWGGDAIYPDWGQEPVSRAYEKQNQISDYLLFRSQTPIVGVWDDHDYGNDNADGSFEGKRGSQLAFMNFILEPFWSLRRIQKGIYKAYEFGPSERKVKLILLDNRYFKNLDPEYPLLGKKQWQWLEKELTNSDAKVHLIVTGLSVLSPPLPVSDSWVDIGKELPRMLDLLKRSQPKGVVFLTGDKHFATIFQNHGHLEFLASGMTHIVRRGTWAYLRNKYTNTYFGLNYGEINFDWTPENNPILTLNVRTQNGSNARSVKVNWQGKKWGNHKDLPSLETLPDLRQSSGRSI